MHNWFKQLREDVDRLKDESAHVLLKQWVDGQIAPLRNQLADLTARLDTLAADHADLKEKTIELSVKTSENFQFINGQVELLAKIKKTKAKARAVKVGGKEVVSIKGKRRTPAQRKKS